MDPEFYWNMCMKQLSDTNFYKALDDSDPTERIKQELKKFIDKHKNSLTNKEYEYLHQYKYNMANLYLLPKLHKSNKIKEIIKEENAEYIHFKDEIEIDGRPIVSGTSYYTHGLSKMIHQILETGLQHIEHILKDTFDYIEKDSSEVTIGTVLGVADIKSLYTIVDHSLGLKAIDYWYEKLKPYLTQTNRLSKNFIMEAISIILNTNYFYINKKYFHQTNFDIFKHAKETCLGINWI